MFGGLSFVIASLLEGAIVNYLGQENQHRETCIRCSSCMKKQITREVEQSHKRKLSKLHKVSRVLFPVAFVLFNAGYWAYYINRPDNKK